VRLGRKKERKTKGGKVVEIPYATPYFVMDDMPPEIQNEYGEEPTTLKIEFLFNTIPQVFPHFHQYYLARGLRCMGDGEIVLYRTAGTVEEPEVCIKDAVLLVSASMASEEWTEEYGTNEEAGNTLRCLGFECPSSKPGGCRPRGRLCFAIQGHEALGYYEMGTGGINAIAGIVGQFQLAFSIFGHIDSIPWKLHLRPETVQANGKSRNIYVPWIEIDPAWLQRHVHSRGAHLRAIEESKRSDIADLYGRDDVEDLDHDRTPQHLLEAASEEDYRPTLEEVEAVAAPATGFKEAVEEAQEVIEGELEGPEVTTKKGNIYERLMKDANHNLKKRGYKARYTGVEEVRQAMDDGGIMGRLVLDKYLDYLSIVLEVKER